MPCLVDEVDTSEPAFNEEGGYYYKGQQYLSTIAVEDRHEDVRHDKVGDGLQQRHVERADGRCLQRDDTVMSCCRRVEGTAQEGSVSVEKVERMREARSAVPYQQA